MQILEERPLDRKAVLDINRRAFAGPDEAALIERLSASGLILLSLVAHGDERPVGHILFSHLSVEVDGRAVKAAALAPMAVAPEHQRCGIGSALVRDGLVKLRTQGSETVIVLGYPHFYARFGFSHESVRRLASPFTQHDAFMGLELKPGALVGRGGFCVYPPDFGISPVE